MPVQNEILLGGKAYPIMGQAGFRRQLITMFPPKITLGDVNKDDEQYLASLIQNDTRGGMNLFRLLDRSETDRTWYSYLEGSYLSGVSLPPYVYNYGAPAGVANTVPMTQGIDFNADVYFAFADKVYSLVHTPTDGGTGNTNWSASLRTLAGNIVAMAVWNGKLWVMDSTRIDTFDGSSWATDATTGTGGGTHLIVHDNKLWRMLANTIYQLPVGGTTWATNSAALNTPLTVNKLIEYRNAIGDPTIYALTVGGGYVLDESVTPIIWRQTDLTWPSSTNAGKGAVVFRGDLWAFAGLDSYIYTAGNPAVVDTSRGLLRDGGLPMFLDGAVVETTKALNDVFCVVDQSQAAQSGTGVPNVFMSLPFSIRDPMFTSIPTFASYVANWTGLGWQILWASPSTTTQTCATKGLFVSSAQSYKLYWSASGSLMARDLYAGVRNPFQNTVSKFQAGPLDHVTPWFQGVAESLYKTGVLLKVMTKNCTSTETIQVYYGTDFNAAWNPLSTVTSNGLNVIHLGSLDSTNSVYLGTLFNAIRFKFTFSRDTSDSTKSPLMPYWVFQYMKQPSPRWGFTITLDLSQDYGGRTPAQMISDLTGLLGTTQVMSAFQFRDTGGPEGSIYAVKITQLQASENVGYDYRGTWLMSVIQPSE